jgi:hypothetical protein
MNAAQRARAMRDPAYGVIKANFRVQEKRHKRSLQKKTGPLKYARKKFVAKEKELIKQEESLPSHQMELFSQTTAAQ